MAIVLSSITSFEPVDVCALKFGAMPVKNRFDLRSNVTFVPVVQANPRQLASPVWRVVSASILERNSLIIVPWRNRNVSDVDNRSMTTSLCARIVEARSHPGRLLHRRMP